MEDQFKKWFEQPHHPSPEKVEEAKDTMTEEQKEKSKERTEAFEAGREHGRYPKIDTIFDSSLEQDVEHEVVGGNERKEGFEAAGFFIYKLLDSVEHPKFFPLDRDQQSATPADKYFYSGWAEHNQVQNMFTSASKAENHVDLYMTTPEGKKRYRSVVSFFDDNGQKVGTGFSAIFEEDGELLMISRE
mgnify:CR=1 FL=1